jgi:hypothetical protein
VSVALVIQHTKGIRRAIICVLSGCTIFIHIILQTARFSKKKVIQHKMCVLIFSTALSATLLIVRRTERDMIKNVYLPSSKVPVILVRLQ